MPDAEPTPRETVEMIQDACLTLALRTIEVGERNELYAASYADELPVLGHTWRMQASYYGAHQNVHISATLLEDEESVGDPRGYLAKLMGAPGQEGFTFDVPVSWLSTIARSRETVGGTP